MKRTQEPRLFLVVLGGRTNTTHVEMHDVRWVVGKDIKETIPYLRQQWFGMRKGLHIDSYAAIEHVDGFSIYLQKQPIKQVKRARLWFVNVGGYDPEKLAEQHEFGLIVSPTMQSAKQIAKDRWLPQAKDVHKDDMSELDRIDPVDNCLPIDELQGWYIRIEMTGADKQKVLRPDWYGYWRID
ncbi:MAG: DUF1543 domain-containing protein [Prochlorococcus sp.]